MTTFLSEINKAISDFINMFVTLATMLYNQVEETSEASEKNWKTVILMHCAMPVISRILLCQNLGTNGGKYFSFHLYLTFLFSNSIL